MSPKDGDLRFIEREGRQVLQQYKVTGTIGDRPIYYTWHDVPQAAP